MFDETIKSEYLKLISESKPNTEEITNLLLEIYEELRLSLSPGQLELLSEYEELESQLHHIRGMYYFSKGFKRGVDYSKKQEGKYESTF